MIFPRSEQIKNKMTASIPLPQRALVQTSPDVGHGTVDGERAGPSSWSSLTNAGALQQSVRLRAERRNKSASEQQK